MLGKEERKRYFCSSDGRMREEGFPLLLGVTSIFFHGNSSRVKLKGERGTGGKMVAGADKDGCGRCGYMICLLSGLETCIVFVVWNFFFSFLLFLKIGRPSATTGLVARGGRLQISIGRR